MEKIIENIKNNNFNFLLNKLDNKYKNGNTILHYSVLYNNIDLLKKILDKKDNKLLYINNNFKQNIFHIASYYKLYNILNYILEKDITILNSQDINGNTGLHNILDEPNIIYDILNKNKKNIKNKKINLNKISNDKGTLLLNFIKENKNKDDIYYKLISLLLELDIGLDKPHNLSPLIYSTKINNGNIVKLLLNKKNIDVNIIDSFNTTAIFYTVLNNNFELFKLLIEKGANINYWEANNNFQLINLIILKLKTKMLDYILNKNINLNIVDKTLELPIHKILKNKYNDDIIKNFLEKTDNLNYQNTNGETPMYLLTLYHDWKKFKDILVNKELDIFIKNNDNKNILNNIKDKKEFYKLVIDSYIKNNKDQKLIKECYDKNGLTEDCLKKIKKIITKNKKSYSKEDIEINFITNKKSYLNKYNAQFIHINIYIIYLLKKYKNLSIPYLNKIHDYKNIKYKNYKLNNWIQLINKYSYKLKYMEILYIDKKINWINPYFIKSFNNGLKLNSKTQFILISLIIITKETNHQNFLLYNKKTNILERFEPYGYINNKHSKDLDIFLEKLFKKINKKIKYISPKIFMNRIGFQNISENESKFNNKQISDPSGFCVAWCIWYIEMKLQNPDIDTIDLINTSVKKIISRKKSFTEYIRDYGNKIIIEILNYFKKIKLNKKYYYSQLYDNKVMELIKNKILKPELDKLL